MLKDIHSDILVFDCEYIPDYRVAELLYAHDIRITEDCSDSEYIEACFKAIWCNNGATESNPRPYLKPAFYQLVSIAAIKRDFTIQHGSLSYPELTMYLADEEHLEGLIIYDFLKDIGLTKPTLVGFNSITADMGVLTTRALVNGLCLPQLMYRPNKPWEGKDYFSKFSEAHIDIMEIFGTYRSMVSLDAICKLCGIPGKMNYTGDDVTSLWLSNEYFSIRNYNVYDTLSTYLLFLRFLHLCGQLNSDQYGYEQNILKIYLNNLVKSDEKFSFLRDFITAFNILPGMLNCNWD